MAPSSKVTRGEGAILPGLIIYMSWGELLNHGRIKVTANTKSEIGVAYERDPLLVEREKTHGSFLVNAEVFQALWAATPVRGLQLLTGDQHLALVMIYVKLARVLSNPKTKDSWDDIAGYAKLGSEACE